MITINVHKTTSVNWKTILQILERNKYSTEEITEGASVESILHIAEFDITDINSLTDLRTLLRLFSNCPQSDQCNVFIFSDKHPINNFVNLTSVLDCYAKTLLPECFDPSSYCCREYERKKGRTKKIEHYFKACQLIDERLIFDDDDYPNLGQYIVIIENSALDLDIILCPNFKTSGWRDKAEEYLEDGYISPSYSDLL